MVRAWLAAIERGPARREHDIRIEMAAMDAAARALNASLLMASVVADGKEEARR